jgi:hypothetical protein
MRKCLICEAPVADNRDFCTPCYQKKIYEIEEEMSKREASQTREDQREAPVSNPLAEDTHH